MLDYQNRGLELLETLQGQEYHYRLEHYTASLSELTIRATSPRTPQHWLRITFQTTVYLPVSYTHLTLPTN